MPDPQVAPGGQTMIEGPGAPAVARRPTAWMHADDKATRCRPVRVR